MRNKDLEKYIKDLKDKRSRLAFELAEVEDELESINKSINLNPKNSVNKSNCSTCNNTGEYWDFWAGSSPCPDCNRGY